MHNQKKEKIVSNNEDRASKLDRMWKLWTKIAMMVLDGKRDPQKVADTLQTITDESTEVKNIKAGDPDKVNVTVIYLKDVFENEIFTVGATSGTEVLRGSDIFGSRVFGEPFLPIGGKPTLLTKAETFQLMDLGGTDMVSKIFESLGADRPSWEGQSQILSFCRNHPDKLSRDRGLFFEINKGYFALVTLDSAGLPSIRGFKYSPTLEPLITSIPHIFVIPCL